MNSVIGFSHSDLDNNGVVRAEYGGAITFRGGTIANDSTTAFIEAEHHGDIRFFDAQLTNQGTILSEDCSYIAIVGCDDGSVTNVGLIEAKSYGEVKFEGLSNVVNDDGGTIEAKDHGTVVFDDVSVTNFDNASAAEIGTIEADGCGSTVELIDASIRGGVVQSSDGGKIEAVYGWNTFSDVTINGGIVEVDCHAALALEGITVIEQDTRFEGRGVFVLDRDDSITGDGSAVTLTNDSTIAGGGTIGGEGLELYNHAYGIIDADDKYSPLVIDTGDVAIQNDGTLETTFGATIQIDSDVDNGTNGLIEALSEHHDGSTVELDGITVSGGEILIDQYSTLHIENGATTLSNVDVENSGNLLIDSDSVVSSLDVETGTTIHGGTITIGDAGELDVDGGSFDSVTIDDKGSFHIDGTLTIKGDIAINLDGGTFTADNGILDVAAYTSATLSGTGATLEDKGTVKIEDGATLTLNNANAAEVDFNGPGATLVLDTPSDFTGTIKGLSDGDTIDFADVGKVTSAVFNGSTLDVNGTLINISGLSASSYDFYFAPDGHGGTDFVVEAAPAVAITTPIAGDNVVDASEAAAGFTLQGTAFDSSVDLDGQTVTVDILDSSNKLVYSFTPTVDGSGAWSQTVTDPLADGTYTVTASLTDWASDLSAEATPQTFIVDETASKIGFNFIPTAASLSALEDGGLVLASGEQIGTFLANGNLDDAYTFTIKGPDHDFTSTGTGANSEALFTNNTLGNAFDFDGSAVYQLTVDVKDATLGQDSGLLPFDVVVDDLFWGFGDSDTIKLTGANGLGIGAATPTIVYGLSGNDTIDATGMTANVWFVGGSGSDVMAGGSGVNTYVFASVHEFETPNEYGFFGGPTDTITNFNAAKDLIDLAPMNTVTTIQGLLTHSSTNVNAASVTWVVSGSDVIVYANTDPSSTHSQDSSSGFESEIILSTSSNAAATALAGSLSASNFILAPPAPSTPDMTAATDTGVSNSDNITNDSTPTFTGTGIVGDAVTLFDGATAIGSAVVGAGGTYSITSARLADGTHSISAEQTDALGDSSALSGALSVEVDTNAPKVAKTGFSEHTITGTFSDPDGSGVVSVHVADTTAGHTNSGNATLNNGRGTWSYQNGNIHSGDNLTIVATDVAGNQTTITSAAPAGTAGAPINLALADAVATKGANVSVTVSGLPTGWSLNEGEDLGNGTWAIQSEDLSQLALVTAAAFAGAMMLNVSETWTNANGTTSTAFIADNVEAYAPGSPIFALAGDDNLTGAGGNDTFVFAQPIGNDTIYSFNAASDMIDLTGFAGIGSYGDLHIADNANGNAAITLGNGETITLAGVDASALSAGDFVFNQTPVAVNHGTITVSDGAELPLSGTIDNIGLIAINSTGDQTMLQLTGTGATLEGGGQVVMSGDATIAGTGPADVLTIVDNTISGSGHIGTGDGNLALVNEAHGVIDADVSGTALVLDTGNAIVNAGLLEASNGGVLQVNDVVSGGHAGIAGGTIAFEAQSNANVAFDNGPNGTDYGKLQLDDPADFSGHVAGFTGTDAAHSDVVDVSGIDFNSAQFTEVYHAATGVLSMTDGTNSANITFDNFQGALDFASDGHGGTAITDAPADAAANALSAATTQGTLSFTDNDAATGLSVSVTPDGQNYVGNLTTGAVTDSNGTASADYSFSLGNDQINVAPGQTETQSYQVSLADAQNPAANTTQTVAVTIGGAGNDNFVFAPGVGHDSVLNFNVHDTVELDHFSNAQTVQELQSLITADTHGNAVLDLGNHDSITFLNTTQAQLQQAVQNGHVLLH